MPLVLAPWEVSSHVLITAADLDLLGARGGSGAWLAAVCQSWLAVWRERFRVDGFNPFDTLAVSWVTHPELIAHADVALAIEPAPAAAARPQPATASEPRLQSHLQLPSPTPARDVLLLKNN